ncbi:anthranilate synthase family protein [Streptomyces sp. 6N223]|uniref:anthranilate synthase family protein n=1 Tax=Streptomyces sp. 6N223 TaxID=3457412 RepID=UPI003FD35143
MSEPLSPSLTLSRLRRLLDADAPFALLRRRTPGHDPGLVELLTGPVTQVARLADIPLAERALALVPYRQLAERGFVAADDGTPLAVLLPEESHELPLEEVLTALAALPSPDVAVAGGGFDIGDDDYAAMVRAVVEREIGAGQGANFVISRAFTGRVDGFGRAHALALFRRLLAAERGAYWTFLVWTGERVLLGASPEAHVRMSGGTVVMNPISGTYRYPPEGPGAEGLLAFLDDAKETEELSMVVDEELKMMCAVGDRGGVVVGPRLVEMTHLAHTEYELRGRSTLDVREVLRETMFAATVTGSPLENACRVIARHERGGRGYYSGALALLGRDAGGAQFLDSPILIRTADIDLATGRLRVRVGATLVRGSDPAAEVAETHAKAGAVLAALGVRPGRPAGERARPRLAADPRVRAALAARRESLAPFWLRMQTPAAGLEQHPPVLVIDGEDTFTSMLAHLLRSGRRAVEVVRYDAPGVRDRALAHEGPVVLGPGPGDPADGADPKMRALRELATALLEGLAPQPPLGREGEPLAGAAPLGRHADATDPATGALHGPARGLPAEAAAGVPAARPASPRGVLGVCLGHELIAAELGLPLVRKDRPYQGAQERIDFFGRPETVGFYSSYAARCDDEAAAALARRGVEVSRDAATGAVHALRGPGLAGVQFHPESVLTLDGPAVVGELLAGLDAPYGPPPSSSRPRSMA